ncbi:hypothetical protein I3760_10G129700 [Carya illinoinensis]|nr:hypothetical protein I3760_10G129700 [Carya illinoinensis]
MVASVCGADWWHVCLRIYLSWHGGRWRGGTGWFLVVMTLPLSEVAARWVLRPCMVLVVRTHGDSALFLGRKTEFFSPSCRWFSVELDGGVPCRDRAAELGSGRHDGGAGCPWRLSCKWRVQRGGWRSSRTELG